MRHEDLQRLKELGLKWLEEEKEMFQLGLGTPGASCTP